LIAPYRTRPKDLIGFLEFCRDFCAKNHIHCIIVNQVDHEPFNRGALINAGFLLAGKHASSIITQDRDIIPTSDFAKILYKKNTIKEILIKYFGKELI